MTVAIDPFAIGCCVSCGHWITPTNEQVGASCRNCPTEWVTQPDQDPDHPVAYWPAGIESDCQGCGHPTYGLDLCDLCDPHSVSLGRPT